MLFCTTASLILLIAQWTKASFIDPYSVVNLKSQKQVVDLLINESLIIHKEVEDVLRQVDRGHYVGYVPYENTPVALGLGASFSPPQVHAFVLDNLKDHLKEGARVLDAGSATGYLTVCMALMVGKTGYVVGVEHWQHLVNISISCVKKDRPFLLEEKRIRFVEGDGRVGFREEAPYDVINIGALSNMVPLVLMEQLKPGGRLIVPPDLEPTNAIAQYELMIIDVGLNGTVTRTIKKASFVDVNSEIFGDRDKQDTKTHTVINPHIPYPWKD